MRDTIIILDGIDTQISGRASKIMQKLMWIPYVLKKSFFFFFYAFSMQGSGGWRGAEDYFLALLQ